MSCSEEKLTFFLGTNLSYQVLMGKFSQKLVSTVVTLSTVLSSVGVGAFAVPSVASAATLMNGDLIKASGPAVYYYANSKRYVFPNETTYRSWFADFSSVRTISDTELSAIMIGGNITMRAGTNLVKITTDPKVYAVTRGGVLRWVETEQVANALFGSNWARRVVDVPDAFFVNYSIGSSLNTAVHPDGSLVMWAGSSDRYVVEGGMRRRVTDNGFTANGFQASHVITTTINYPNGTDVTTRESNLADAVVGGSGPVTPVSGSLTVSLASDTSPAMVIPKNAHNVMFTKVNLMGGNSGATISSIKFRRVGVGNTSDFENVYLYKADGTRLTSGRTVSSSDNTVTFSNLNMVIGAGMTESVYVSTDIVGGSITTGGQHAFEITDAGSVMLSGTGTVSGSFPVRGNAMTIGTASVARVDVIDGAEPANPRVGAQDTEIANFRLQANGSNDVEVRRVTLYQAGTISNSDLTNLKLYQGSTLVASAMTVMSDGKIVLNFASPFTIPNGQSRTFNLRGAVSGRSGRTIRVYTEYSSDVYVVDKVQNVGTQVCINSTTSPCNGSYDGSSATTSNASYSTTEGGQFTVTYNGPATANVGRGQNDVVFYRFAITSGSNNVEIRRFNIAVTSTGSGIYDGSTEYLRDIKIKDADTGETVAGPISCTSGCTGGLYKALNSGSISVMLNGGQTRNFVVTGDTSTSITDGTTYLFALGGASSNAVFGSTDVRVVSSGEFLSSSEISPNTTVTGNTMTVRTPTLNVTLSGAPSSAVFVKNQRDIGGAGFTLTAGTQNTVRVTSMTVTGAGDVTGSYVTTSLSTVVNSCGLFDGSTQVGNRMSPNSSGSMTFSGLNLMIDRGVSKSLEVRCNADSTITQTAGDKFALAIASTSDISAQDEDGNTVTPTFSAAVSANASGTPSVAQTVKSGGSITITSNDQPTATILVADGSTWNVLARYSASTLYENAEIDYLGVTSTGPSANFASNGVAVAQATDSKCNAYTVRGTASLASGHSQPGEIDLSQNPIVLAKGTTTYLCLLAKLSTLVTSSTNADVTTSPRSGNVVALGIPAGALTVGGQASSIFTSSLYGASLAARTTGVASGERLYQTIGSTATSTWTGNSHIVRKAKLVVTQQNTGLSNTLAAGQRSLYRAQIGSQGGQSSVKQLTFKLSVTTTSAMTLSNFRVQKNGADMNLSDIDVRDAYGLNLESNTLSIHNVDSTTSTLMILVRFTNEEVVSGTGNTYSLNATVGGLGTTAGDSIVTQLALRTFSGTVAANAITGWLSTSTAVGTIESKAAGFVGIATSTAPGNSSSNDFAYAVLWSDMSEQPHYSNIYNDGTAPAMSRDWTNEYLVDTISGSHVLNK